MIFFKSSQSNSVVSSQLVLSQNQSCPIALLSLLLLTPRCCLFLWCSIWLRWLSSSIPFHTRLLLRNLLRCLSRLCRLLLTSILRLEELFLYSIVFRIGVIRRLTGIHIDGAITLGVNDLPAHYNEADRRKANHRINKHKHGIGNTPCVIRGIGVEIELFGSDVATAHILIYFFFYK